MTINLTEAGALTKSKAGHAKLVLITPGKGSSGNYSEEVLKQAEADRVFQAGCLSFIDHATDGQEWERPEGSIKDLAGVLTEDAHWDDEVGGLVAEAKIFEHWRPVIESMADSVGVSIRASGEVEESQGGRNITRLVEARSVDFVTRAGRGGRVLSLLESERPSTLDEISEIFQSENDRLREANLRKLYTPGGIVRPSQTTPAPAGEDHIHSETKEAAAMADEITDTSRVDEADSQKPTPPNSGGGNGGGSELERLRKENAELKAEIARLKAAKAKEARRTEVAGIVEEAFENTDAGLVKDLVVDKIAESDATGDDLIAEAKKYADDYRAKNAPTGQVRGLGESRPINTSEADDGPVTFADLEALKGA